MYLNSLLLNLITGNTGREVQTEINHSIGLFKSISESRQGGICRQYLHVWGITKPKIRT